MKQDLPLSDQDISLIKRRLIPLFIFSIIAASILGAIFYFVLSNITGTNIAHYVFGVFGILFMSIIAYHVWSVFADIKKGTKVCISGLVTDKRMNEVRTSRNTGKSGSSTRTKRYYYISLDGEEQTIENQYYYKARVGTYVVIEKAPKSGFTLAMNVSDTPDSEATTQLKASQQLGKAAEDMKFLNTPFPEQIFSEDDLRALTKSFYKDLKSKLFFMLPIVFIIVSLLASELGFVVIFLFPIVIIPIVQGVKITRRIVNFIKNKRYNYKLNLPSIIEDKSTHTSNTRATSNKLITTQGQLSLNRDLYNSLSVGQKIIITKPKYGNLPLSLMTLDQKEYYL